MYDNCPVRCLAPHRDKPNGCPDCDYTIAWNDCKKNYHKALRREIERDYKDRGGGDVPPEVLEAGLNLYSFDTMLSDYNTLSALEERAGTETAERAGGIGEDWNIRTFTGIKIIREERYKIRREAAYERKEELERLRRQRGKNG